LTSRLLPDNIAIILKNCTKHEIKITITVQIVGHNILISYQLQTLPGSIHSWRSVSYLNLLAHCDIGKISELQKHLAR